MTEPTTGRVWGYARCFRSDGDDSIDRQKDLFVQRAAELEREGQGKLVKVFEEKLSAEKLPYDKRPEFAAFMEACRPGDTLIVWRLDRIDRNPFRMIRAVEFLVGREIRLIVLKEHAGMKLDLSTAAGRAFIMLGAIFADFWMEYHREAVRSTIAYLKANGLPYSRRVPFGKRRITVAKQAGENGRNKRRKIDVWDDGECRQIVELVIRKRRGETYRSIGRDWIERKLCRACGVRWTKRCGRLRHPNLNTLHRAYRWAEEHLRENTHIGNVPM